MPLTGYEDKKIYIWAENVLGYLSASKLVCEERGESFEELWGPDSLHYYVHGKDNIPFHTIILPALLIAHPEKWHLPDQIISSEYLTLEGRKISTSQNYAVWVSDILQRYDPDSLRYYLLANGPEKKDSDFSFCEFINSHNGELLGAYGNFINRTLVFCQKYQDGIVPQGTFTNELRERIQLLYDKTAEQIEAGEIKDALDEIFVAVRDANKLYDTQQPWITRTQEPELCSQTIHDCIQLAANFAVLLAPFLPFSSKKVCEWFSLDVIWNVKEVHSGYQLPEISLLFQRIDKKLIAEETEHVLEARNLAV